MRLGPVISYWAYSKGKPSFDRHIAESIQMQLFFKSHKGVTKKKKSNARLTNFTEQSPSWEANTHSASQEIYLPLRNRTVHYRIDKSPLLVPILRQMHSSTPSPNISLRSVLILFFHTRLGLPSGLFPTSSPTKNTVFLITPRRATCRAHLILLDLITLIIFYEDYKVMQLLIMQSYPNSELISSLDIR